MCVWWCVGGVGSVCVVGMWCVYDVWCVCVSAVHVWSYGHMMCRSIATPGFACVYHTTPLSCVYHTPPHLHTQPTRSVFYLPPPRALNYLLDVFNKPALVFQGALDPLNDAPTRARSLQQACTVNSVEVELVDAGHCPFDENPEAFNVSMMRFVGRVIAAEQGGGVGGNVGGDVGTVVVQERT